LLICITVSGDALPKMCSLDNLSNFLTYMHVYVGNGRGFILVGTVFWLPSPNLLLPVSPLEELCSWQGEQKLIRYPDSIGGALGS